MNQEKNNFKKVKILHIILGIWILLSAILSNYYGVIGSGFYIPSFIVGILYLVLVRVIDSHLNFVLITLILLHTFQVFDLNITLGEYYFIFGPHLQIDIYNWFLSFIVGQDGIALRIGCQFGDSSMPRFKISISSIIILTYLIYKFSKLRGEKLLPWESEYLN